MNKVLTHVAVGVSALGLGITTGYLIGKKRATKRYDAAIKEVDAYWVERLNEAEGPAAVITSGSIIETPIYDGIVAASPEVANYFQEAAKEIEVESAPMYVDQASELNDDEEIQPDFPDAPVEVVDDFTVEGIAPAVDARAFVEQFKNRSVSDLSAGVTYPGSDSNNEIDPNDPPVKTVPDFILVRDPNGPYVISIDDFMDPESDPPFTKVEMRYFAGDNVVVDARDDQVPIKTVGAVNLTKFGEGTTDPNQVYIRNERLGIDIEVTRESGLYLHEVLGQDFADKTPILKMREGDDR